MELLDKCNGQGVGQYQGLSTEFGEHAAPRRQEELNCTFWICHPEWQPALPGTARVYQTTIEVHWDPNSSSHSICAP